MVLVNSMSCRYQLLNIRSNDYRKPYYLQILLSCTIFSQTIKIQPCSLQLLISQRLLQTNYKSQLSQLMRRSILLKKLSNQTINHSTSDSQTKTSKIWTKYSLIFSQPKANFIHGLLSLAQKQRNSVCLSFEEDEPQKQDSHQQNDVKNEAKANPFLMAKARLLKQKQSLQTEDSNPYDKLHQQPSPDEFIGRSEKLTITWKQMLQLEKKNQKMELRPFTERK